MFGLHLLRRDIIRQVERVSPAAETGCRLGDVQLRRSRERAGLEPAALVWLIKPEIGFNHGIERFDLVPLTSVGYQFFTDFQSCKSIGFCVEPGVFEPMLWDDASTSLLVLTPQIPYGGGDALPRTG